MARRGGRERASSLESAITVPRRAGRARLRSTGGVLGAIVVAGAVLFGVGRAGAAGDVAASASSSPPPGSIQLAPPPRHELIVFFAPGHEPLTTLDLPITAAVGEVGTANLYVPGDVQLFRLIEELGWTAVRRSERYGHLGGYVVSFPCTCEKALWWKAHIARMLSTSASIDSVRTLDEERVFFAGEYTPSPIFTERPAPPDSLAGIVWVRAAIDTCGRVVRTSVERSSLPAAYESAARAAARRWRFNPANCEPLWWIRPSTDDIAAEIVIPFRFE